MSFRFLHTADWHLGRILYGASLEEDQAWALDRLVELAREVRPDAVVVAGDVYDRAVPSREAVALLDDVLARLVHGLGIPVLLIAGNHDSPERLGFASGLLGKAGLHVAGPLSVTPASVLLGSGREAVRFWLLPYSDPISTRGVLGVDDVHDHESAVGACLAGIRLASGERNVLVTHHFVTGGVTSESERLLSVGGSGAVAGSLFAAFDYVALGHLHRPQPAAGGRVLRYAGSLLKYSFDEATHEKSVAHVELAGAEVRVEELALGARRDVRRIQGLFDDLIAGAAADTRRDDYLEAILLDEGPVHDALGRLRTVYPNALLAARRLEEARPGALGAGIGAGGQTLTDDELFRRFFREVTGDELEGQLQEALGGLLEEFYRSEREAGE